MDAHDLILAVCEGAVLYDNVEPNCYGFLKQGIVLQESSLWRKEGGIGEVLATLVFTWVSNQVLIEELLRKCCALKVWLIL